MENISTVASVNATSSPTMTTYLATTDTNGCTTKPCLHGTCVNQAPGYDCACFPGWTGPNCTQDIDECNRRPCQHGRCENKDGGYNCTCSPGWTGQNCQQDIDECTMKPCQHGRCENKDGGYKCTCTPGWTGQNCQQALQCPPGWEKYNDYCYMLRRKPVKWDTANKICKRMGAHLASVQDKKENDFIKSLISTVPYKLVWVGLSDIHKRMKWADGTRVSYTNWNPGQPDNSKFLCIFGPGENCGGLYKSGKWNDSQCSRKYPFVCKAHVTRSKVKKPNK
ncbi:uncharacterized protein LOC144917321 isoform X1 [Branchiostoma floridae x Branchiostoma belcheri]